MPRARAACPQARRVPEHLAPPPHNTRAGAAPGGPGAALSSQPRRPRPVPQRPPRPRRLQRLRPRAKHATPPLLKALGAASTDKGEEATRKGAHTTPAPTGLTRNGRLIAAPGPGPSPEPRGTHTWQGDGSALRGHRRAPGRAEARSPARRAGTGAIQRRRSLPRDGRPRGTTAPGSPRSSARAGRSERRPAWIALPSGRCGAEPGRCGREGRGGRGASGGVAGLGPRPAPHSGLRVVRRSGPAGLSVRPCPPAPHSPGRWLPYAGPAVTPAAWCASPTENSANFPRGDDARAERGGRRAPGRDGAARAPAAW